MAWLSIPIQYHIPTDFSSMLTSGSTGSSRGHVNSDLSMSGWKPQKAKPPNSTETQKLICAKTFELFDSSQSYMKIPPWGQWFHLLLWLKAVQVTWLVLNQEHSSDNYSAIKVILGHDYFGCAIRKSARGYVTQSIPHINIWDCVGIHQQIVCPLTLIHEMIFPQTDLCLSEDLKTTKDVGALGGEADLHIRPGPKWPKLKHNFPSSVETTDNVMSSWHVFLCHDSYCIIPNQNEPVEIEIYTETEMKFSAFFISVLMYKYCKQK